MTEQELAEHLAANRFAAVYAGAAIVLALRDRGLLPPGAVAAWADTLAAGATQAGLSPSISRGIQEALEEFAKLLRRMDEPRPGGDRPQ